MPRHLTMKKLVASIFMTALPLALTTAFAEARGAGVGFQSPVEDSGRVGRAYSPKSSPVLPSQMESQLGDEIVAEHTQIQVHASEAESLLNNLRSQLAAQPDARLSIRWQLTRPVGIK